MTPGGIGDVCCWAHRCRLVEEWRGGGGGGGRGKLGSYYQSFCHHWKLVSHEALLPVTASHQFLGVARGFDSLLKPMCQTLKGGRWENLIGKMHLSKVMHSRGEATWLVPTEFSYDLMLCQSLRWYLFGSVSMLLLNTSRRLPSKTQLIFYHKAN